MIKFFRHIRQSLLSEGKNTKYLKYAIGEIILVVIGILIALQINNWNEQQKENGRINTLINNLKEDLHENILDANRVINWNLQRDSLMRMVLSKNVTIEDYKKSPLFSGLLGNYNIPLLVDNNLPDLLDTEDLGHTYRSLKEGLNLYQYLIEEEQKWFTIVQQSTLDEINRRAGLGFTIYDNEFNDELHHYFLTDQSYYNRLYSFRITLIGNYNRRLMARRNAEVGLLQKINSIQNGWDINAIRTWLKEYDIHPFQKVSCTDTDFTIPEATDYRNTFLFVNTTSEDVYVDQLAFDGNVIKSIKVETQNFISSYLIGLDNQFIGSVFQISDENGCRGRYRAVRNGYLIIE